MIEELRQFGDEVELMVTRCNERLLTLRHLVDMIAEHRRHGDLFADSLIAYLIVKKALESDSVGTLQFIHALQAGEDFFSFLFSS